MTSLYVRKAQANPAEGQSGLAGAPRCCQGHQTQEKTDKWHSQEEPKEVW